MDTTPEIIDVVIRKLISHIDLIDKGIKTLRLKNVELYNSTTNRRAKKKKKRVVLSIKLVLTTESAKILINAREAAEGAK